MKKGGEDLGQMTLRQMRRVQDITQAQMAQAIGVSIGTYQAWEKCPAKVPIGKLIQIAKVLGCNATDLKIVGDGGKVPYVDRAVGE